MMLIPYIEKYVDKVCFFKIFLFEKKTYQDMFEKYVIKVLSFG